MTVPRSPRVTIPDVARAAGVSTATAGRALGGYGPVRAEIREKVLAAAQRLSYRPNQLARSMVTGRSHTLGVVGADISNPFFAGAMRGIADVARAGGFGVILTNSDEDVAVEREAVELLLEKQVDGLIVAPADVRRCEHVAEAVARGTPVTLLDRLVPDLAADAVQVDNITASRAAVGHLLALGHRRIAIVAELRSPLQPDIARLARLLDGDPGPLSPSAARLLGYLHAHRDAGVAIDFALIRGTGRYDQASAEAQARAALALPEPPTALFTADNVMTLGAYTAVRSLGLPIPDGLSFVAFDDLDWMPFVTPALTAVAQPVYDLGAEAARLLLQRIQEPGRPLVRQRLPARFVARQSTAPPRGMLR